MTSIDNTDLSLPSQYEPVETEASALLRAVSLASNGAPEGTLVHGPLGAADNTEADLDVALIIEPEVDADRFAEFNFISMVSLGQAIASSASPMITLQYGWPDLLQLNDLAVARTGIKRINRNEHPSLVLHVQVFVSRCPATLSNSATLRIADPENTATGADILGLYARHFLHWINHWSEHGMDSVMRHWRPRLDTHYGDTLDIRAHATNEHDVVKGVIHAVNDRGDLAVRDSAGNEFQLSVTKFFDLEDEANVI